MKFRDYCSLIADSVAETGYDSFYPSACVPGLLKDTFHVLEGELSEEGEERVATSWAESLSRNSNTMFLAFRSGSRKVAVLALKGHTVADRITIHVNPYSEESE